MFTAAALAWFVGCASIVSGRRADIAFDTYPKNACVAIHDDRGRQVTSFNTPGVATLKRQKRYFLPAHYTATITAPGYQTAQVPISSTLNPWILGNIEIGGIPGLVVDSATGAAWKPQRSEIHQHLMPLEAREQMPVYSSDEVPQSGPAENAQYTAEQSASESKSRSRRR
jgi:hypothetical protein